MYVCACLAPNIAIEFFFQSFLSNHRLWQSLASDCRLCIYICTDFSLSFADFVCLQLKNGGELWRCSIHIPFHFSYWIHKRMTYERIWMTNADINAITWNIEFNKKKHSNYPLNRWKFMSHLFNTAAYRVLLPVWVCLCVSMCFIFACPTNLKIQNKKPTTTTVRAIEILSFDRWIDTSKLFKWWKNLLLSAFYLNVPDHQIECRAKRDENKNKPRTSLSLSTIRNFCQRAKT